MKTCLVLIALLLARPAIAETVEAPLAKGGIAQAEADMERWKEQVGEIVDANLNYPLVASLQREGGTTGIRLIIDRSGRINLATVEQPSGNEDIDDVTLRMFQRLTLPPLPASYKPQTMSFLYTIQYRFSWH